MVSPTNTDIVLLTGENNYMRLHVEQDGPMTTRAAHWRILLSPGGAGHVLFLTSDVTDNGIKIYSDNIAVARWLQDDIIGNAEMKDPSIPVITAAFDRTGDAGRGLGFFRITLRITIDLSRLLPLYNGSCQFITGLAR